MSEPLIFITTSTINDGGLDGVRALSKRFTEHVEAADTGLLAFGFYLSDDGTEVSNVQVHRDAVSMEAYLPLAQGLIQEALQLTTTLSIDVHGTPGPILGQVLRVNAEQGARVRVTPSRVSGFTRA